MGEGIVEPQGPLDRVGLSLAHVLKQLKVS